MKEVVLKTNNLTKQYNKNVVLDNVNITIKKGDIYGLIGRNGAGKTTLMKIITTLASPTSGTFELFNTCSENDELFDNKKRVGSLIEYPAFYPNLSAYDNLKYYTIQRGIVDKNQINKVLELVNLTGTGKKKVKTFSLGMKQRLGIAQAMLNNPKILILDEPTAGLDPKERVKFRNLISSFSQDKIVILSTHIVSDIEFIADEIIVMKAGKKILTGTPEELLQDLRGSVWKCVAYDKKEVEMLNHKYCIINIHQENNTTELRIVSRQKPTVNAVNIEPNLEDLYLAYFQDNEK